MKFAILLCAIALIFTQQVMNNNVCDSCTQMYSQSDCQGSKVQGCEWVDITTTAAAKCQLKTVTPNTFKEYCLTLTTPQITCAKIQGCAFVDTICTHFSGCTAYAKTTTIECQAISFECVSDGVSCIEAKECVGYKTQAVCQTNPSISGTLKCVWDSTAGACRDQVCSEADSALTTNAQCANWLAGCVTRGKGCWSSPLPACATYTGDDTTCNTYIGSDGNCELATGTTQCKVKECAKAAVTLQTDDGCKAYQIGCITTGKGCIQATTKPLCATYTGDITSCVGYIGSDGICEGDAGGSQCRARKCENGTFPTDTDCDKYRSGCKTNGKICVTTLGTCSSYQGTTTTCNGLIGSDGYCKGTSATTSAACAPKVCEEAPDMTTTDDACSKYQVGCKSTGKGCAKTLSSCTSYTGDATSCQPRIGSEGNCTWASGTNCIPRTCAGAPPSNNTNLLCGNWLSSCVTTGSGCISKTTCEATVKDLSCMGTDNCSWSSICTSNNNCSQFKTSAICTANKARIFDHNQSTYLADGTTLDTAVSPNPAPIYKFVRCAWTGGISGSCNQMVCTDLTGTQYSTDAACQGELPDCISNKKDSCIANTDCSKLTGTRDTCKEYAGYCYNSSTATDTAACTSRLCTDNTDAKDTPTCDLWLPGCITNGAGCVLSTSKCADFRGNKDTCNTLIGFVSGAANTNNLITQQCYNTDNAIATDACLVKICSLATGKTSDSDCQSFLNGCVYDGNTSCLDYNDSSITCSNFKNGTDATYCDKVKIKAYKTIDKYCYGSVASGACKIRFCSDNTTATSNDLCNTFMKGCIMKSGGGCEDYKNMLCASQTVTATTTCQDYFGYLTVNSVQSKVRCTRVDVCLDRTCGDKLNPSSQSDCTGYKSTCRFLKSGASQGCIAATGCGSYVLPDSTASDTLKFGYCSTITDTNGVYCGFKVGDPNCSDRGCEQLLSIYSSSITCASYILDNGNGVCKQSSTGNYCYTPNATCASAIPATVITGSAQLTYCQSIIDTKSNKCTFTSGATCQEQNTCELLIDQSSAKICNDSIVVASPLARICQYASSKCYTTNVGASSDCTGYTAIGTDVATKKTFCETFKAINNVNNFGQGTAVFTPCTYPASGGGATCILGASSAVASPASQADCASGTFYQDGACLTIAATSCTYSFTASELGWPLRSRVLYCLNLFYTTYCQIKSDASGCAANTVTDCNQITPLPANWNGVTATWANFCVDHSLNTKIYHCVGAASGCQGGVCGEIVSPTSQFDCQTFQIGCYFAVDKCLAKTAAGGSFTGASGCSSTTNVPWNNQATTAAHKIVYCQLFSAGTPATYCTYDSTGSASACAPAAACSTYALPASVAAGDELAFCKTKVNLTGMQCLWTSGTNCVDWNCSSVSSPKSQIDCDSGPAKSTCTYYQGTCFNQIASNCNTITVSGDDKKAYCEALTITPAGGSATKCTYISGDTKCTNLTDCAYDVSSIPATADKQAACGKLTKIDGSTVCLYITGSTCTPKGGCSSYTTSDDAICKAVVDGSNLPCKLNSTTCQSQTCSDQQNAADCGSKALNCFFYQTTCLSKDTCVNYTPVGTDATAQAAWCKGAMNSSGNLCKWDGTSDCTDRQCGDVSYFTDFDCNNYLKGCKTDGTKCVAGSTICATLFGDDNFCNALTDGTGKDKCKPTSVATNTGCSARTCYDNVSAASDPDCESFMSGCVTRKPGCIPNVTTCDSYRGIKDNCETFKQYTGVDADGNATYQYCSGDTTNVVTSACKNRTCADNKIATDDAACITYLKGCVTNGAGCLDKTSACTLFKGDQAGCAKFMGNSGQDYCWNTTAALATATCLKKKCTDINGQNDKDCDTGMLPFKDANGVEGAPFCVYDGVSNCTDNNKSCSYFKGSEASCATYTASNGPCKATTIGTIIGPCTPRICIEAPNTLTTDAQCKQYHPTCYTTGYGCTTNTACTYMTNQVSCSARVECAWATQCKTMATTCATFSGTSQSQCVNSKVSGKNCAWTETGNICRAQTCADQPAAIKDHATCQVFSTTCTTNDAGCVTLGVCSTYQTQSICNAASTTIDGISRCGWENNACRNRTCGDKQGLSNSECNTHLAGCKTNGASCVTGNFCNEFSVNQQYCQKSNHSLCLWVNGVCYDYERCEDASFIHHTACQQFSPLCTTNGTTCIPITSCANTALKASCVLGTDGKCGWLPIGGTNTAEKCQKFGVCTDAVGATNDICQAYGSECLSDGTTCIAKANCSGYLTSLACGNAGLDGICFWNATLKSCKLQECGDSAVNNTTDDGCKQFTVASGSCTTDGQKCIPLSTCSLYLVEAGCVTGTDGVCTFALPIGTTTTGTTTVAKSCRQKQCSDIQGGTTNSNCSGMITGKKCVSNGASCIAKAACSTYTSKLACNGGGVDSTGVDVICVFTVTAATAPNVGTCKQFTLCSDANNDKDVCVTKAKACQWTSISTNGATTTACNPYTCDTFAVGTDCQPVPSFDGLSSTVCLLQNGKCAAADPGTIADAKICYAKSAYTYSWNSATNKCQSCIAGSTINNGTNGTIDNVTNNATNGTTGNGYILGVILPLGFLGFMA